MSDVLRCSSCFNTLLAKHLGVACKTCLLWYHIDCTDLKKMFNTFGVIDNQTRALWACRFCKRHMINKIHGDNPHELISTTMTRKSQEKYSVYQCCRKIMQYRRKSLYLSAVMLNVFRSLADLRERVQEFSISSSKRHCEMKAVLSSMTNLGCNLSRMQQTVLQSFSRPSRATTCMYGVSASS